MESSAHTGIEATDGIENNQDAHGSLVGAWSGTYEYGLWGRQGDGLVSLSITEHEDGRFEGSGIDGIGAFTVDGTIVGNKVIFTKSYTIGFDEAWKYIGFLDTEMTKIVGRWGPVDMEDDVAAVSAVEGSGHFNHPGEGVDGNGIEDRVSSEQTPSSNIVITVEGASGNLGKEQGGEVVGGDDGVSEAGSAPFWHPNERQKCDYYRRNVLTRSSTGRLFPLPPIGCRIPGEPTKGSLANGQ